MFGVTEAVNSVGEHYDRFCESLIPYVILDMPRIQGPACFFTWAISQELCLQQAVLKHEVRSFSGPKNRLAYSLLSNGELPKLDISQLQPEPLCVRHPSRVTSCCAPWTWGPGNHCTYAVLCCDE